MRSNLHCHFKTQKKSVTSLLLEVLFLLTHFIKHILNNFFSSFSQEELISRFSTFSLDQYQFSFAQSFGQQHHSAFLSLPPPILPLPSLTYESQSESSSSSSFSPPSSSSPSCLRHSSSDAQWQRLVEPMRFIRSLPRASSDSCTALVPYNPSPVEKLDIFLASHRVRSLSHLQIMKNYTHLVSRVHPRRRVNKSERLSHEDRLSATE